MPAGGLLGALVVALLAGPAHSHDAQASAPVAAAPPAATPAGLVQMPDGRLLAPEFARIVTRGELVVAVLGVDQPPFFESRNGELAGVDIDLANEIAKKLGVAVRFNREAATFDGVVQLLATGRADLAVSKLSRTLPRAGHPLQHAVREPEACAAAQSRPVRRACEGAPRAGGRARL